MKLDFRRFEGQGAFLSAAVILTLLSFALTFAGYVTFKEFTNEAMRYRQYQTLKREAPKADSLSQIYTSVLKDLEAVHKALPLENPASVVLSLLVDGASRKNLKIVGINGLDEIPFQGFKELPFDLSLSGRFVDLTSYLHGLESQGMVLKVRHLSIQSEALNKSVITAKLELSVFIPTQEGGTR